MTVVGIVAAQAAHHGVKLLGIQLCRLGARPPFVLVKHIH